MPSLMIQAFLHLSRRIFINMMEPAWINNRTHRKRSVAVVSDLQPRWSDSLVLISHIASSLSSSTWSQNVSKNFLLSFLTIFLNYFLNYNYYIIFFIFLQNFFWFLLFNKNATNHKNIMPCVTCSYLMIVATTTGSLPATTDCFLQGDQKVLPI